MGWPFGVLLTSSEVGHLPARHQRVGVEFRTAYNFPLPLRTISVTDAVRIPAVIVGCHRIFRPR